MAVFPYTINLTLEVRPCEIIGMEGLKALFHKWEQRRDLDGGVVVGLVEVEDGHMLRIDAENVRFLDTAAKMSKVEGAYILAEERREEAQP